MKKLQTPYFLIDESLIEKNCKILEHVRHATGCKILLAQKAYSCYDTYPLITKYLDGTTASGLFEAKLGKQYFGGETHIFAPAFTKEDMAEIVKICDHIVFNSIAQLKEHYEICKTNGLQIGLRVNPEHSTQDGGIYDPCASYSRFGVTASEFEKFATEVVPMLDGLHFHTLCEQGFEPLAETIAVFEKNFGKHLLSIQAKKEKEANTGSRGHPSWVNFGGGHHIVRADYNVDGLIKQINDFKSRYRVQVYLEPGEAVVLNSGTMTATVLDIVENGKKIAIVDKSAACHNPDILETQHRYTPEIIGATNVTKAKGAVQQGHEYRLAGNTCLSGDVIGDYIFPQPLQIGDIVTFTNMALYTIVKTNMFNGINLPSIYVKRLNGDIELIREFGYNDYKIRLGR